MSLLAEFNKCGNPFKETCHELVQIHTRSCAKQKAIERLRSIVVVGKEQYQQFVNERFVERTRTINDTSKRNSLTIFKENAKLNIKSKEREVNLKSDYSLFSRLFIANQSRHGDMGDFFSHEYHPWPPSLSDNGKLRLPPSKSNLLLNFKPCNVTVDMTYDDVVVDAPAIVHSLLINAKINTFNDYLQVFISWIHQKLQSTLRLDIVWDRYKTNSLKESTREKRGTGVITKVSGQAKLPAKFKDFLLDSQNKQELFTFLTENIYKQNYDGKIVTITNQNSVFLYASPAWYGGF